MQSAVNNGTSIQMAQNKVKCRLPNNKPPKDGPKLYRKPKTRQASSDAATLSARMEYVNGCRAEARSSRSITGSTII